MEKILKIKKLKPLQYCKVIRLQLIKINEKKKKKRNVWLIPVKITLG